MLRAAFVGFEPLYTSQAFAATTPDPASVLSRMAEGPVWLAEVGTGSVGTGSVGTVSAVDRAGTVWVRGMAVLPSSRGLRLGALLLDTVESFARTAGASALALCTTPFLAEAISLYGSYGFVRSADGPTDLHGTPLIPMTKSLG